jgi:hypothetical protein
MRTQLLSLVATLFLAHCSAGIPVEPPVKWSDPPGRACSYDFHVASGWTGSKSSTEQDFPRCTNDVCSTVHDDTNRVSPISDPDYWEVVSVQGKKELVGTCESGTPIACDASAATDACVACLSSNCCTYMVVAEADANVAWLTSCVNTCGTDHGCQERCADAAQTMPEPSRRALSDIQVCARTKCSAACN